MKPLQRIICIKAIQKNFRERDFSWDDVYSYLHAYDDSVGHHNNDNWESLEAYVSNQCELFTDETIALMYEELLGKDVLDVNLETVDNSLWRSGYYRLFISHLTKDKVPVSYLKKCLSDFGIDCFVAHEDIEPSKEWLKEIKKALRSADALCAVFSEGFCGSKWCDQEVGIALGRRIPILSIKKGADPHGFLSEYQAIPSKKTANEVAEDCFTTLCSMEDANEHYYHVLTKLLLDSGNVEEAAKWIGVISKAKAFPDSNVSMIYSKCKDNSALMTETSINKLNVLFKRINRRIQKPITSIDDSDLPF